MRQAGRSLPEYRRIREGVPMLESCMRPELITEITLQPVRRYGVDAAILFSDIVVPLKAIGVDVEIVPGVGPVIAKPVASWSDLDVLRPLDADDVPYVTTAVRDLVAELGSTPLIGFAGAPFTLASYLIEGGPSKSHERTKALMYAEPELWHALLERLADITTAFLRVQVLAGAGAIQLFDSWAGELAPPTIDGACCPTAPPCYPHSTRSGFRASTSGSGRGSCSPPMGRQVPTLSGSTGAFRSTKPPAGWDPDRPCRAISTRPSSSHRGTS